MDFSILFGNLLFFCKIVLQKLNNKLPTAKSKPKTTASKTAEKHCRSAPGRRVPSWRTTLQTWSITSWSLVANSSSLPISRDAKHQSLHRKIRCWSLLQGTFWKCMELPNHEKDITPISPVSSQCWSISACWSCCSLRLPVDFSSVITPLGRHC